MVYRKITLVLVMTAVLSAVVFALNISMAFAADDDEERVGINDDAGILGNNISSLVLWGTILAILGAVGYAGYKLLRIQQKKSSVAKGNKPQ